MKASLRLNSFFTLTSNVVLAFSNWFILILIAKAYTPMDLGSFVLALSIASTGVLLASFKLRTLLIVDTNWDFPLESYAMSRFVANVFVSFACGLLALSFFPELPLSIFVCVLMYKWADSVSEFCHSYARRNNRFDFVTKVTIYRSVVSIIVIALNGYYGSTIISLLLSWLTVAWIFALNDIFFVRRSIRKHKTDRFSLQKLISKSALSDTISIFVKYKTIAVALVISALFVYLPNFMLSKLESVQLAGTFASISYFLVAGGILVNSLSQAATPQLTKFYGDGLVKPFNRLLFILCSLGISIGVLGIGCAWFLGEFFLSIFYNEEIAQYSNVLNWVMLAAAIRYIYIFIGTGLAVIQNFEIQTKIYGVGLVVMFLANFYLIPSMGIEGAGIAMVAAAVTEFSLYLFFAKSAINRAFNANLNYA